MLAARISLFYWAIFLIIGLQTPFLPLWLDARGLSVTEISIAGALPLFIRIVATPMVAYVADRSGDHRRMVITLAWSGLACTVLLSQSHHLWPIILLSTLMMLTTSSIMPLTETLAMRAVRAHGLDYGRMRLWGSISFIVATLIGGAAIERWTGSVVIWLIIGAVALTALAAHALPRPDGAATGSARPRISRADVAELVTSPLFLLFLAAAGLVQAAHAVFYVYGVLHWRGLGLSATWTGALWAIAVIAEIALFARSGAVLKILSPLSLIALGAIAAIVRWIAMAFDPPLAALVVLQVLHALTFGATHIGTVHFIAQNIPPERAGTAQALQASVTAGIAMGGATLLAGQLYGPFGAKAYLAMAVLGALGLAAAFMAQRRLRA
ncbi:MFS transporter [Hyphomicrobium sp. CS1BSMeth3]|uniref:MFS transporter n=1 Tax=Hyphomicrobium sp. CS1BSMeth3 TaxID=1892844 RepID=UPI000931D76C|nr:MFS transporter [Hyphomicrobium sp. CS1BSMeth3]